MAQGQLYRWAQPGRATEPEDEALILTRGLNALGGLRHPDYVARFLIAHGITGQRLHQRDCPIAKYLRILVPSSLVLVTFKKTTFSGAREGILQNPAVVMAFVYRFDAGEYTALRDLDQHHIGATESPSSEDVGLTNVLVGASS